MELSLGCAGALNSVIVSVHLRHSYELVSIAEHLAAKDPSAACVGICFLTRLLY